MTGTGRPGHSSDAACPTGRAIRARPTDPERHTPPPWEKGCWAAAAEAPGETVVKGNGRQSRSGPSSGVSSPRPGPRAAVMSLLTIRSSEEG